MIKVHTEQGWSTVSGWAKGNKAKFVVKVPGPVPVLTLDLGGLYQPGDTIRIYVEKL